MQLERMAKPAGWEAEQTVQIRRDWITFLANGMGIDTEAVTGTELETLLVRKMLEQAVSPESVRACLLYFRHSLAL